MRRLCYRYQRTIDRPAQVQGVGFLTGADVRIRFRPAPPSTNIVFVRTDLDPQVLVPASINEVSGTQRRTELGRDGQRIGLVEHVLAALSGLRIDNCYVEIDGPEPPGMDGSAKHFVEALRSAGTVLQPARRQIWSVDVPYSIAQDGACLTIYPSTIDELKVSYILDYGPHSPIGRQIHTESITPDNFTTSLASCRTFILESEASELRHQGLGARTTTADLLVFGPRGPIGNRLRHADEPARHKLLDLLGDFSLLGHDLRGHIVAYRSGHTLNIEMVRQLARLMGEEPLKAAS